MENAKQLVDQHSSQPFRFDRQLADAIGDVSVSTNSNSTELVETLYSAFVRIELVRLTVEYGVPHQRLL